MMFRCLIIFLLCCTTANTLPFPLPCEEGVYGVGVGQSDITGPIAEINLMGYAQPDQNGQGLHMRLRSRAFVLFDPCQATLSAIIVADLGMIFSSIKEGVLRKLHDEFPNNFRNENFLLSATHTHSGPGGYSFYSLYNVTSMGFNRQNYEAIVDGIVESVRRAMRSMKAGHISYGHAEISQLTFNRSLRAYENNPANELSQYQESTPTTMHLLKFEDSNNKVIGAVNWFSVHPVSLSLNNVLVSGDNKGLAAYILEKQMGTTYRSEGEFVGAFAQADAGDVSPYDVRNVSRDSTHEWRNLRDTAAKQARVASELLHLKLEPVQGPIDFRHQFVDMEDKILQAAHERQETCSGALGFSFAAGTENGKPAGAIFDEGLVNPNTQGCHKEKPIFLNAGDMEISPNILPFQIMRIGQVTIAAVPSEMTTMAGRRLRAKLDDGLGPVIIAGLSNEYSHYVATREEYAMQHYEGASTLYGPWTELAYREIFSSLLHALKTNRSIDPGKAPPDLRHKGVDVRIGVVLDAPPNNKRFGDIMVDAPAQLKLGETAAVSFVGAHPNNDLRTNDSYLTVERLEQGKFTPIYHDWDPNTILKWRRSGIAESVITIEWQTSHEDRPGIYRICHKGAAKVSLAPTLTSYQGCSQTFALKSVAR